LIWPSASGHVLSVAADTDEECDTAMDLRAYWKSVRDRYHSSHGLGKPVSTSQVDLLPANWTVINISMTEDKSTMFFSRQRPNSEPLLFCVPLERHGRKDENVEEQFLFDDAMHQLEDILRESDQSAKDAKEVPPEDRDAKAAWWAKRVALDKRLRDLLDNIEFCWLGAFKVRWGVLWHYIVH
jgi:separase